MQVSIEKTTGLERRLTVGVPAEEVDKEVTARLQKATGTVRIAGFRPGKVPFKVVRQRYGVGVRQEVVGEIVNRSFYDAVMQQDVRPAGQPNIEPTRDEPGFDLEYVATFEVYPDIELKDFSSIKIARPAAEVTADDVEKMIQEVRRQRATWVKVERAAAMQDTVNIDYRGTRDGEEFAGGQGAGSDLLLGSGRMIAGFEDAIAGMSAGDQKTVALTFPDDYHDEGLQGAQVEFQITVNSVSERQLPELDDELFAQFGVTEGGEERFREDVRKNMERELAKAIKNKTKNRLFKALSELHQVDVPQALVKNEIAALRQQMLSQFGGAQQFDSSIFPDDLFAGEAGGRVALGLLIAEIVKVKELEVDADKVRAQIEEMAATYEQPEQVLQYYYSNEQALNSVQSAVLEEQVVEYVLSLASVTDEPATYQEVLKPDPREEPSVEDETTAS